MFRTVNRHGNSPESKKINIVIKSQLNWNKLKFVHYLNKFPLVHGILYFVRQYRCDWWQVPNLQWKLNTSFWFLNVIFCSQFKYIEKKEYSFPVQTVFEPVTISTETTDAYFFMLIWNQRPLLFVCVFLCCFVLLFGSTLLSHCLLRDRKYTNTSSQRTYLYCLQLNLLLLILLL